MFIPKEPLTKENIFKKISSYDIFRTYSDNFVELNKPFCSDLRQDNNPSCSISFIKGDLIYTDFGEGSYRAVDFVMRLFTLSYPEALNKINIDFNLGLGGTVITNKQYNYTIPKIGGKPAFKEHKPTIIRIKQRDYTTRDLEYWGQYCWTKELLEKARIKSLSYFWIDSDKLDNQIFPVSVNELSYSFEYYWNAGEDGKSIFRRKIYSPERDKFGKWWSNVDNTIVQGFHLLPKEGGDLLVITSSLKDCGIFWMLGYNAIAPNNEESLFPQQYIGKLISRWKRIILWFDNDFTKKDNPGIKNAKKFNQKYGFEYFYTPDNTEKDPSDYIKQYGLQEFKQLIESKL